MTTTKTDRTVFHVTAHDGKWIVTRDRHPDGEYDAFETRDEAVERARGEARQQLPSQVKVHRADGSLDSEFTLG